MSSQQEKKKNGVSYNAAFVVFWKIFVHFFYLRLKMEEGGGGWATVLSIFYCCIWKENILLLDQKKD